eukprot:1081224-Alexandrium_andersonii.AAC.1
MYVDDVPPPPPAFVAAPEADALEFRLLEEDVEETCPICVDRMVTGEAVADWPDGCGHLLRYVCLMNLLQRACERVSSVCPLCQRSLDGIAASARCPRGASSRWCRSCGY